MTRKLLLFLFFIALGYLLVFTVTYKALEDEKFYTNYFSSFMPTYENQNGNIVKVNKPFSKIKDEGYKIMDAAGYAYIRNNFYTIDPNNQESNFNFGFFPLFPIVWSFFSDFGIIILNYFLHFASIIILAFAFCRNKIVIAVLTILALPTLTVFLLPYSEALFMFSISIALLGYTRKNKYLYVSGLIMASATRPIFLLFVSSLIATEVYQHLRIKKTDYKHLLTTSAIVVAVTFLVALFQYSYHKGSLFTFMTVQKHWGTYFRIPNTINDWSFEGYGMNVWALLFFLIFGITILVGNLFKKSKSNFDYWYYFSWMYIVATCVYVLFFQGGCLHSLYRYTFCSPFFYIIVFQHINNIETFRFKTSLLLFCGVFISSCLFFSTFIYPANWGFTRNGFVLLAVNVLVFILCTQLNNRIRYFVYVPLIIVSIIWNCYLYNMFFSKAWIFL